MILGEVKPTPVLNLAGAVQLKVGRGHIASYDILNTNASVAYVQLFDLANLTTVNTAATAVAVIPLTTSGRSFNDLSAGWFFQNGIVATCTTSASGSGFVVTPVNGTFGIE
jgi:hypothetical protein